MPTEFPRLLEPLEMRGKTVRHRIVVVGYRTSDTRLRDEIEHTLDCDVVTIGDAKAPRLLRNAVSEGARTGAAIQDRACRSPASFGAGPGRAEAGRPVL